jgi:hypothetical protein
MLAHAPANLADDSDDLVTGHAGEIGGQRAAEFIAGLMDIGMAYTAELDVDPDVLGSDRRPIEFDWC